jgi:hypothetical protein
MFRRILSMALFCAILAALALPASAVAVEQVQAEPPDVSVYIYEDGTDFSALAASDISAEIGGKSVGVRGFSPSSEGIFYIFLLDISASIPQSYFDAAREAVLGMRAQLRPQDRLAVVAFGNKVRTLLSGGEDGDQVKKALAPLKCTDDYTAFYSAMNAAVDLVLKTGDMRCVAVVVSDGISTADADMTQDKLEEKLRQSGVAVNALCIDTAKDADVKSFRNFLHVSGGELYLFNDKTAGKVLSDLLARLDEGWVLRLDASGADETGTLPLHLKLGSLASVDTEVTFPAPAATTAAAATETAKPSETAAPPEVVSAEYDADVNAVKIAFSRSVTGADSAANYTLTDSGGTALALAGAEYREEKGTCYALLRPAQIPATGDYRLSVSGMADASDAKNALTPYRCALHLATSVPESAPEVTLPQPAQTQAAEAETSSLADFTVLIVMGAVLLAILLAVFFLLRRRHKKPDKPKEPKKKDPKTPKDGGSGARFIFTDKP